MIEGSVETCNLDYTSDAVLPRITHHEHLKLSLRDIML